MSTSARPWFAALSAICALVLVACGGDDSEVQAPLTEATTTAPTAFHPLPQGARLEPAGSVQPIQQLTTGLLGSLRPGNQTPEELVPGILARGRLIVGVDQSQNLLSFKNPRSGQLEGFEIDIAYAVAADIFGDSSPNRVEFRYVDTSTWTKELEDNQVDIVLRSVSITRARQDVVFFSTPYFTVSTRLLVNSGAPINNVADVNGQPICVSDQSTGLDHARTNAPQSDLWLVRTSADCLLMLQQGHVTAIVSDDTILSGMAAQDPQTQIVGDALHSENYGIAIAKPGVRHNTEGLIRQVNKTLERIFRDGTWLASYNVWLRPYLPPQNPPALNYREETEAQPTVEVTE